MGLRGFFDTLKKIAAQPDKDFGELVRQRRRKRGLPVAPAGKALPFLPVWSNDHAADGTTLNTVAETALVGEAPPGDLHTVRARLAERRIKEALLALEEAGLREAPAHKVARLEQIYAQELAAYGAACNANPHGESAGRSSQ
jgi:hypothetical protein